MSPTTPVLRRCAAAVCLTLVTLASMTATNAAPTQGDLSSAQDRLMELERDFQLVVERYNLVNERFTELQARIGIAEATVTRIENRMRGRQAAAVRLATELYKNGRGLAIEGILSADSLADLETKVNYLQSSGEAQARVFERLAVDRDVLDKQIQQLDRDRERALVARNQIESLRAGIESKLAEQQDEVDALRAEIEAAERRAAAAAARQAAAPPTTIFTGSIRARPAPAPNARAQAAVDAALAQVGKPYQWGGSGPDSFDCSGLTMWSWAHAGVSLPHNSGAQYSATVRVDSGDWAPGDLLFFGSPIHHVGMYIGNGQMVEAPYSGARVRVNSASRSDYVGAGRPGV
jgi:cell wall-associated NlpC family hydrolase